MIKPVRQYRYNVGDIVQTSTTRYKVLQQTRIEIPKRNFSIKAYKVQCLKCGYVNEYSQAQIHSNYGCGVCNGKIIVRGINSIQDKAPWMIDWLSNPQDSYKYAPTSNVYVQAKCPDCGYTKKIILSNLNNRHGFKCPVCSDGKSFPERFMTNLFLSNNVDFIPQLSNKDYSWIGRNRYDFFLPLFNTIVEVNGLHHYQYVSDFLVSGKEQQDRDAKKKRIALQNGIQSYIVLDCSNDTLNVMRKNIQDSGLLNILGVCSQDIKWQQIYENSIKSMVKKVCDYHKKTRQSCTSIGRKFKISYMTVRRYLIKGTDLGWTTYVFKHRKRQNKKTEKSQILNDKGEKDYEE